MSTHNANLSGNRNGQVAGRFTSEKESAPSFVTYLSSFTGERAYQLDLQSCRSELLTSTLESSACGSNADRFTSEIDEWTNTNESL